MYIGNLVLRGTFTLLRPQNDFYKILITFLDFGITVLICVGIGWIIKKVFGKYSRMIAGCSNKVAIIGEVNGKFKNAFRKVQ